jgi:hypothetical protein
MRLHNGREYKDSLLASQFALVRPGCEIVSCQRAARRVGNEEVESKSRWLTTTGAGQAPVTFGGS